ncbi:hypothetical protein GUITHDRAFT_162399, partial [Guillardia theta CCMP2712]
MSAVSRAQHDLLTLFLLVLTSVTGAGGNGVLRQLQLRGGGVDACLHGDLEHDRLSKSQAAASRRVMVQSQHNSSIKVAESNRSKQAASGSEKPEDPYAGYETMELESSEEDRPMFQEPSRVTRRKLQTCYQHLERRLDGSQFDRGCSVDHAGLAQTLAQKSRMMNVRVRLHGAASPLHHAASLGLTEILLEHGASVHINNTFGAPPLHYAAYWNNINAVHLLMEAGADVNAANECCWTALHHSALSRSPAMMELLLAYGGDPGRKTDDGHTVWDMSRDRRGSHVGMMDALRRYGWREEEEVLDALAAVSDARENNP